MSSLERFLAGVLLAVVAALGVRWYGAHQYGAGEAAEREAQHGRELAATVRRVQDNDLEAAKQHTINLTVTETKNEELAPVRARIAADRVRVGPALCDGPAAAPEAASAQGGNGADPAGRVVRSDLVRDIRALKLQVEEALATGRTCQAWAVANGMGEYQPTASSPAQTLSAATSSAENITPEK